MKTQIGTLGEKSLHAALKTRYCPDPACHEVEVAGGVADICCEGRIVEIQTGSLFAVRRKLDRYYACRIPNVTVIYPLIRKKWICRVDPETGEVSRRRSPKTGKPWDALYELSHLTPYLCDPRLELILLETDVDEYRGAQNERGRAERIDRIPLCYGREIPLRSAEDFRCFLPEGLPDPFTVRDLCGITRYHTRRATAGLYVLCSVGVLRKEKEGRKNVYYRQL